MNAFSCRCEDDVVDPPPCNPADEKQYEEQCKIILSGNGPFKECHFYILPQIYFESCVYDQCATGGDLEQFCNALESYAAACEGAGVNLGDWRKGTVCDASTPTTASTPRTTTPTTVTTVYPDKCQMSCSFDVDLCSWKQSTSDNIDWIRHRGPTASSLTGPSFDHTTGNGFYIHIDGRNSAPGDVAQLESPECELNGPHCLRFWYHMFGVARSMELRVYILGNAGFQLVSSQQGNKGDIWRLEEVSLPNTGSIQIFIQGVRGEDYRSDVAVDDISFVSGHCVAPTTSTTTRTTTTTTQAPLPPGSCVISGDPHYQTFDNQLHHFMGTCIYTLSKVCEDDGHLPFFNVEAANEHRGSNTKVSYVKYVNVDVHGYRITLEKERQVKVDGISVVLPVTLTPGVNIFLSGNNVRVTTTFGLSVMFDGNHRVEVKIPGHYGNKVCGICGNFNGNITDDFLNPDGELESNSADLGNSWQVDNDTSCSPGTVNTPDCTDDEKNLISSNNFCGLITDTNGPFRECHTVINPNVYFTNCLYDMCELNMDPESLCNSLQSYAEACQSNGITIHPWRNETFCPLQCSSNSHYEQCGTACPATCVNPGSPSTCTLPCTEGCFCNPGYVLYDKKCVPVGQCGCWNGDKHYPVGSEFWTDDTCSTHCRCPSAGGGLICSSASCPPDKYCGITNGKPGCYDLTFGNCVIYGDPHYNTFDKEVHHFMGVCTYTLSKFCRNSTSPLPYFNVEAKNEHRGNPTVSYVQKVMVDVYNNRITIVKNEPHRVMVNGAWTTLPVILVNGSLTVTRSGRYIRVETDFKLTVSYDTDHTVEVNVPTTYFNQTCGICGNLNGDRKDDFMMPNGQQAQNSNQLGDSWKVNDDDPSCTPVPPPPICPPEKEEFYKSDTYCGLITSKDGPFQACHSVINPDRFLSGCVFDLCALGDAALCNALEAYGDACQGAGVSITWRNSTFCPLKCPANSHYNPCSSACPATCLDQTASNNCNKSCIESCQCDDGFVLSGSTCVPVSDCGCLYNGKYYQKGDIFWQGECDGQCKCVGNNHVDCNDKTCEHDEICKVQGGNLGCYKADATICHIHGDPHYITFDGKLYHFQGACTYTTVETCKNSSVNFSVTTRNEHRGSLAWTALNSVAVSIGDLHVILAKNKIVYVNGSQVTLPVNSIPGISIYISGSYVVLQSDIGLEVKFDGDHELFVKVHEKFKDQLCGLCGTYTDNILDDFLMPNGLLAFNSNEFGNSWRIPDDDWVCEDDVVDPPPCIPADEKLYEEQCKIILSEHSEDPVTLDLSL
ncbi:c-binding -like [Pelobates cultripes]|uniref:C-binding -like n=1 Tax=Pelobates cultripes TaxID=61616 RepID=A0AAD1VRJ1_PELCU|nr:c-binding -like [Pelobates cultripes]